MSDYYTNSADISPEALGIFAGIFMFVMFIVLIFYLINIMEGICKSWKTRMGCINSNL